MEKLLGLIICSAMLCLITVCYGSGAMLLAAIHGICFSLWCSLDK